MATVDHVLIISANTLYTSSFELVPPPLPSTCTAAQIQMALELDLANADPELLKIILPVDQHDS